ncbi:SCO family protein [Swingsia samuiensis]|uniref:SCO family protein n=1 Tax=Swingsia samuiensis TaxID=1293412 RepID=A0A4Y6UK60_9PROT|nr:SCO family protein [Swingsia samuiensis]QDH17028.1 SCO family protein [Swingsia samuiensis]
MPSSPQKHKTNSHTSPVIFIIVFTCLLLIGAIIFRNFILHAENTRQIGGPYSLLDGHRNLITQNNFKGHFTLIYFGYTHCIDVCPLTLATVSEALKELELQKTPIIPLFISVDPTRDTPENVEEYVSHFSPHIIGLTGSAQQIQPVLNEFHVTVHRYLGKSKEELLNHSSLLYLMGPHNNLIGLIPVDSSAHQISTELKRLLSENQL